MNRDWSDKNKEIQKLLGKESTFREGIQKLIAFRGEMFEQITQIWNGFPKEAFYQMPFAGADGYHSKTLSYSVWHIFRIEDIVAHELIVQDRQIFFDGDYQQSLHASIITTGNELAGETLVEFSKSLDIDALYLYAKAVMEKTNAILDGLSYADMKRRFDTKIRERLTDTHCVSEDESAAWLITYWCEKDVRGLIKMPFCRHWIMHIEAMQRIKNKLCKMARKGVDPVAYCGLSCNHCFLGQWCGSCRTAYHVCSFATCFPDKKCPNISCCEEKGLDGCYECEELMNCQKGFYCPENEGACAAKTQALYISKHGKKEFLKAHDRIHQKYDFSKTQELLGQDVMEGLKLLESI